MNQPSFQHSILGAGCSNLRFAVSMRERTLTNLDFELREDKTNGGTIVFTGDCSTQDLTGTLSASWLFAPYSGGWRITLEIRSSVALTCVYLDSLVVDFSPGGDLDAWRIPTLGLGVESVGMIQVRQLEEILGENPIQGAAGTAKYAQGSLLRGAFPNSRDPGLFLGTILPQKHRHLYNVERIDTDTLSFSASTHFVASYQPEKDPNGQYRYLSETTWVSRDFPILQAIAAYAGHLPKLAQTKPPVGWNSWDYYFSAVTQEDILENVRFIQADTILSQAMQYVVIDMGWEHCWGEWYSNYRFSDGLEQLAGEINARGLVPGIWTAPLIVHPLSYPGLRAGEMFIKNEHGDPWPSPEGGQYAVDPTSPAGQAFLREIFTRLHRAGFRLFKIDFVSALIDAPRFHDSCKGPYEALTDFFHLVRECVGPESHILGCSLPEECGPGLADSHRTGIDIHNQWTHIEWAVDFYQFAYWQSERIAINDPDFLVVRGQDSSLETETNVLNPNANNPKPPRWRRGPVFTLEEARTWATFTSLAGGSVFLSDRPAMLNDAGLEMVRKVIGDAAAGDNNRMAVPLDLADGDRPSLWYAALEKENRLGIINWSDSSVARQFTFSEWGLAVPQAVTDFWSGESMPVTAGVLGVTLPPHASAYVTW